MWETILLISENVTKDIFMETFFYSRIVIMNDKWVSSQISTNCKGVKY